MVVTQKSDGSVVLAPSDFTLISDQTNPSVKLLCGFPSHEGIYLVTVNSKLYNESAFTPSFVFEVHMHPSPCVHTKFLPSTGTWTKCSDEHGSCSCTGLVRFGKNTSWTHIQPLTGSISCVSASFGNADPLNGVDKQCDCMGFIIPDMHYQIHPANIPASTQLDKFEVQPDPTCIIQYKFTSDTPNPTLIGLLTKEAHTTNVGIASSLALA